jgi:hypothetical protein
MHMTKPFEFEDLVRAVAALTHSVTAGTGGGTPA